MNEGASAFDLVSEPPPLPQHLRAGALQDHSRVSVFAGLARAGHAFRRRIMEPVLHQVSRSPGQQANQQPLLSGDAGPQGSQDQSEGGVFTPDVAEAMKEWTRRPSLLVPSAQRRVQVRDESSTSSLSPELVKEEVRRQVQLAMAEKNNEVKELRVRNEIVQRAVNERFSVRL